ncbi:MAG: class I SAM-dependent methyltransferase [Rhodospirillaceae bacterium]|nr:class I SAM-dependent methyltransferase [Rhodospirillaceae bacterium]MBT5455340.1 class I SAM-dependent methyltransferase [Rhodospirillaceae bacterium]
MAFALLKRDTGDGASDDSSGGASLKERLHAWWNGYELPPESSPSDRAGSAAGGNSAGRAEAPSGSGSATSGDDDNWSDTRRQLAQEIWSPGFVVPGGNDYVEKLVSGCSLTEAETMLEIGVGMGGGTRTIIGKFGNYVTGYERNPDLAAAAVRHAVTHDIDDKLEMINTPLRDLTLKPKYFRAALLRDILHSIEDKVGMMTKVSDSLKTGEAFLVLTNFLFDADDDSPELVAWKEGEERPVYPWTERELIKCLESLGIQPRIVEDEGEIYRSMVVDSWSAYMKTVKSDEIGEEMGREMAREGEFWARRTAALETGALKYFRVEAVKNS